MATKRKTKAEREALRLAESTIRNQIFATIEENAEDWRRDHLGASLIGKRCERHLWLSFRWALDPEHDGQKLRLFGRGHREEPAITADLTAAGFPVSDRNPETQKQYRFKIGHLGGSGDGLVYRVPGREALLPHILEMKTHNLKSFTYLKSKRVRAAKTEHFAQCQLYMHGMKIPQAVYIAVCKDNDDIYVEIVDYEEDYALRLVEKAERIIAATEPPERMDKEFAPCVLVSKDGTRWPCDYFELCHGKALPERNCRTCIESTPSVDEDGEPIWTCDRHELLASPENQRIGCENQMSIPTIVNADVAAMVPNPHGSVTYQFEDGTQKTEAAPELLEEDDGAYVDPLDREGIDG